MIDIVPALMPRSSQEFFSLVERIFPAAAAVQVDIMDGKLTPEANWPYIGDREIFEELLRGEKTLPHKDALSYEADLMVREPLLAAREWIALGAERIILHINSDPALLETAATLRAESGGRVLFGLGVLATTPIEKIAPLIPLFDFVQCMGIARIGFQGEPFDERVLAQTSLLREMWPERIISVDGGVTEDTAKRLVDAGARRLVIGSSIVKSPDPVEAIARFTALVA